MKNIKARRNGIVAAGSNGTVMINAEAIFRYIANFRYIEKFFLYSEIFAVIEKFRYIAKILFVAKFSTLVVLCINDPVLVNFISTLVIVFVLVFYFVIFLALSTI